jgi:hypothetical protein
MAFLAASAIVVFILVVEPRVLVNWKLYPALLLAGVAGLSIHLVLPLRAGLDPVINEAAPTCESLGGAITAVVTYGKAGCAALAESLTRSQYDKPELIPRQAPLLKQYLNYLQYFDWQWARGMGGDSVLLASARIPFTMLFTGLGVWGAMEHLRRDRASFLYVLILFGTLSAALVYYLNFRYGYSIPDPYQNIDLHEVRERDYFFVAGFSVWGLWAGIGIATLWQWLGRGAARTLHRATPVLALALIPLGMNWSWASRAQDYSARDWAYNLLMSVEPYGILFTNGDNDTFPLWYLQEVEGMRRDVTVIVTSYLNTAWYARQLRDLTRPCPPGVSAEDDPTRILCQRSYEENTPAIYASDPEAARSAGKLPIPLASPVRTPTRTILAFDDAGIRQAAETYTPVDRDRVLVLGNIEARLRGGSYLYPWQLFALNIINASMDERPIYFASSGAASSAIGVDEYLVREGLAFRLHNGALPDTANADIVSLAVNSPLLAVTGRHVDAVRTRLLVDEVFIHRGGIPAWEHWPDQSTIGIPNYYSWAYYALAQAAYQLGATDEEITRLRTEGDLWNILGS